ncbi:MAG TPA: LD-carboxypeptidase [Terriglobales bacterium]|jgi:muramoyltetrapeptide carboxypeptidase|nr:LD-carboxypeptidase [Terriglobales bacterium]
MPSPSQVERIKPPALRAGDSVGIVAPASYFKREDFEAGCAALREMGYKPVYEESIFDRDLYFAGSVDRRVRELESMFTRDDIRAIICARGGYGSNYLLSALDVGKISSHPKAFIGYSDNTSLQTYLCDAANLVTFHGPMVAKDFAKSDGIDFKSWQSALSGRENWRFDFDSNSAVKPLAQGSAEGLLYGGCLSMLVESLGTPYEIRTEGTILFVEDIATKPYQIDRMLTHLKLAGKLNDVRGIIFGEMLDCVQAPNQGYTLEEVVMRIVGQLGIPVAYGLRSGHVSRQNITLPMGVSAVLNVGGTGVTLEILEPATTA